MGNNDEKSGNAVGYEYKLIRSNRRTLGMELGKKGLIVRAPFSASDADIRAFMQKHSPWIEKHLSEIEKRRSDPDNDHQAESKLTSSDIDMLAKKAAQIIPERVRYYAPLIGVSYGRITIRNQRTKWGSCSSKGNLNFNCLLMLTPPDVIDSVVVHELCHRKEMNHSTRFYSEVKRVFPDYDRWNDWLKKNGSAIMRRMTDE
ncbi:MAG: M48 family metallopeptidase [Clostridia bacterium]|nr:M48 family metallopeptidase [Clostridia bacterium]